MAFKLSSPLSSLSILPYFCTNSGLFYIIHIKYLRNILSLFGIISWFSCLITQNNLYQTLSTCSKIRLQTPATTPARQSVHTTISPRLNLKMTATLIQLSQTIASPHMYVTTASTIKVSETLLTHTGYIWFYYGIILKTD